MLPLENFNLRLSSRNKKLMAWGSSLHTEVSAEDIEDTDIELEQQVELSKREREALAAETEHPAVSESGEYEAKDGKRYKSYSDLKE